MDFATTAGLDPDPRDSLLLQPGTNTKGSLPGRFHGCGLPSGRNSASSVRARRYG